MRRSRFTLFAWSVLGYNLAVILWGAYVRATGSGAGCGNHWPDCDGQILPRARSAELLIEFTHRASSGISLILACLLAAMAFRAFERGHRVRMAALAVVFLTMTEALVGA